MFWVCKRNLCLIEEKVYPPNIQTTDNSKLNLSLRRLRIKEI